MKEYYIKKKWIRIGFHKFPSFNLAINISRYQFSFDLIFFWFDMEW